MGTILFKGIWTYTLPILYIAAFSITVLLSCGKSATGSRESAIFYVPSQFATIQEAIDGSADGDLVLIASGTYSGNGNRDIDFGVNA